MTAYLRRSAAALVVASIVASPAVAADEAAIGAALFRRAWVPAPSATRANDGLGPHFDARSCAACHPGGGRPAVTIGADGVPPRGLVVRAARPDGSGDPIYGSQIQGEAVNGLAPEARLALSVASAHPRRWRIAVHDLADGPLAADTALSLRLAPALHGAGAIEAVPEAAIRALADPDDRDGDGIAGRVSEVVDGDGRVRVGRWGFKATAVDLADQTSAAFSTDMGLSTARRPDPFGDCSARQTACRAAPAGSPDSAGSNEIGEPIVAAIVAFLGGLEPAPSSTPPPSPRGAAVFAEIGCAACHAPLVGDGRVVHSDLLLHDMGAGLASGPATSAVARAWRTAPLIGLGNRLAAGTALLHDGRARTLDEAIVWHDGEAATARRRHAALSDADRRALLDHLSSLR